MGNTQNTVKTADGREYVAATEQQVETCRASAMRRYAELNIPEKRAAELFDGFIVKQAEALGFATTTECSESNPTKSDKDSAEDGKTKKAELASKVAAAFTAKRQA